jgi:hypothetical protein
LLKLDGSLVGRPHAALPAVPVADKQRHSAKTRAHSAKYLLSGCTLLLAGMTAGCSYIINPSSAAVAPASTSPGAPPAPLAIATAKIPRAKAKKSTTSASEAPVVSQASSASSAPASLADAKGSLVLDEPGSGMTSWNQTSSYCPQTSGMVANGTVTTDSTGAVNLTTPSKAGSCVGLISPGAWGSDVIEADVDFPALPGKPDTIANWVGVWLTNGPAWPVDGELDAVEVEPVNAVNAVTWHSGTRTDEFSASTSGFAPVQLPQDGNNVSPGWHVIDVVYTKGYFGIYYDGDLFTSYTSSNVTGSPLNVYFTMANTPATASVEKSIGAPPINSSPSPATMSVRYLKVWSYK